MPPLLGVLGAWMTFKKAEMAKTLRNGLSMIETNPLNHIWSDLVILLGLSLNRFQKKLLLRYHILSFNFSIIYPQIWSKPNMIRRHA